MELNKINLLGNLFLAETLVSYPLVFLIGLTLFYKNKYSNFDLILFGISLSICFLGLGPIWPALLFLLMILVLKKNFDLKNFAFIPLGFLLPNLFIWPYVSFEGYLRYYILANLNYTIPGYSQVLGLEALVKSLLTPLISFGSYPSTATLWVIRIGFILLILNFIRKRDWKFSGLIFLLLGLTNLRFIIPGTEGYTGFHFMPYFSSFVFILSLYGFEKINKLNLFIFLILSLITLNYAKGNLLFKRDDAADFKTNFSTLENTGNQIKALSKKGDELFVSSDSYLLYWQSGLDHIPKLFGYYGWMVSVPELHGKVIQTFSNNPPKFFYCDSCSSDDLKIYLSKYERYENTNIYILK